MSDICCGVDEAGRGPVIGPMVMAIVCAEDELMSSIGAKDSKLLSPSARERIYNKIIEFSESVHFSIITSIKINEMMGIMTLNEIEEKVAVDLIGKYGKNRVFVDAFDVNEERLSLKLSKATGKVVISRHKGDVLFPVVSAASIIAKVVRDREIEEIRKKYGDFGSGYPSDPKTISFIRKSLKEGVDLTPIARIRWSTYTRIVNENKQSRF